MYTRYEKWIEAEFFHDYYRLRDGGLSKLGADLEIEPTPACAALMAGHQILFRRTRSGFRLSYRTSGTAGPSPLIPLLPGSKFTFYLFPADAQLGLYSDLPLDAGADICLIDNLTDNRQADPQTGRTETLLARGPSRYLSGADFVSLRAPAFPYAFDVPGDSAVFEIRDGMGSIIRRETLTRLPDGMGRGPGSFETYVDLGDRPEGAYSIWVNGERSLAFYAGLEAVRRRPFGVIELHIDEAAPAEYRLAAEDPVGDLVPVPRAFTVRLKNRETAWRYYVGLKYKQDIRPENLSIAFPDAAVSFTRRGVETRMGDLQVVPFDTDTGRLPLRKAPVAGIRLMEKRSGGSEIELTALPNPDPANLKRDGATLYSEVFVYV